MLPIKIHRANLAENAVPRTVNDSVALHGFTVSVLLATKRLLQVSKCCTYHFSQR